MYKSPIEITHKIVSEVSRDKENKIVAKVKDITNINIDKDELIKALQYDCDQYVKGYNEGYIEGEKAARERFCNILEYTLSESINYAIKEWDRDFESYKEKTAQAE